MQSQPAWLCATVIAEPGFESESASRSRAQAPDGPALQPGDHPGAVHPQQGEARQSSVLSNPSCSQPGREWGGGPLGHEKCRWGRGGPPAAGPGGAYAGQMVRPQHMPLAQLLGALPAASREGHVCIAGPGPCAGLLQAGWERVQGKAWPCWAGEGRGQSCGPRPPPQNLLVHRLCSPSGHLVCVQICADFLSALMEEWQPSQAEAWGSKEEPSGLAEV